MGVNSRSKGTRNERRAAELVTKWTGHKFAKTPASGGLHWKKSFVQGDIVCTVEGHYCPFCFEIKAHKEIDFSHLLNPKIKEGRVKILEFWNQARRDATLAKKIPLLLMRYDGMPSELFYLVMEYRDYRVIQQNMMLEFVSSITSKLEYKTDKYHLIFLVSTNFFELPYSTVRKIAKTHLKKIYA